MAGFNVFDMGSPFGPPTTGSTTADRSLFAFRPENQPEVQPGERPGSLTKLLGDMVRELVEKRKKLSGEQDQRRATGVRKPGFAEYYNDPGTARQMAQDWSGYELAQTEISDIDEKLREYLNLPAKVEEVENTIDSLTSGTGLSRLEAVRLMKGQAVYLKGEREGIAREQKSGEIRGERDVMIESGVDPALLWAQNKYYAEGGGKERGKTPQDIYAETKARLQAEADFKFSTQDFNALAYDPLTEGATYNLDRTDIAQMYAGAFDDAAQIWIAKVQYEGMMTPEEAQKFSSAGEEAGGGAAGWKKVSDALLSPEQRKSLMADAQLQYYRRLGVIQLADRETLAQVAQKRMLSEVIKGMEKTGEVSTVAGVVAARWTPVIRTLNPGDTTSSGTKRMDSIRVAMMTIVNSKAANDTQKLTAAMNILKKKLYEETEKP